MFRLTDCKLPLGVRVNGVLMLTNGVHHVVEWRPVQDVSPAFAHVLYNGEKQTPATQLDTKQ